MSGGRDHVIRVWDMETLVCRHVLTGHRDDILHIQVRPGLLSPHPIHRSLQRQSAAAMGSSKEKSPPQREMTTLY